MANISSSFTQLLPTELYVAGISTNVSGSYTYNGPETFDVHIEKSTGKVAKINVNADPGDEGLQRVTINAKDSSQLPAAYICSHVFHENYVWNYTYTDETMSNGDVYKKIDNPDLRDAYELSYNFTSSTWSLDQIIKELRNDSADEAKRRRDFVKTYADQYTFGTDIDTKIDHYIAGIGTYLGNNPDYKTWKYINLPASVGIIPKIPIEVQVELTKVSINGPIGGNV
tara:strand:- start:1007 stop:1687 length:681 start_codon:yes stop_codon:yes gene_type:complete